MIFSPGINAEGVWAELGFCPGRSEFFNIGDKNFGLNAYAELCDVARMHVPWFGTPEFDLNVNNQLKIQVSVLGRHFDVLAAELRAVRAAGARDDGAQAAHLQRSASGVNAFPGLWLLLILSIISILIIVLIFIFMFIFLFVIIYTLICI